MRMTRSLGAALLLLCSPALAAEELVVLDERFDDNRRDWWVGDEDHGAAEIARGRMKVTRKISGGWASWSDVRIHQDDDFRIEASLRIVADEDNYGCGLWFGAKGGDNGYVFEVGDEGQYRFFHYDKGEWVDETGWQSSPAVRGGLGARNTVSVQKQGPRWLLYVNGQYVDRVPARPFYGHGLGVRIEGKMACEVDDLRVVELVPGELVRAIGGKGVEARGASAKLKVLVLSIEDGTALLRPADLEPLAEYLAGCLAATGAYTPLSRWKLKRAQLEACHETACQAKLARAAGAEAFVTAKLLKLADVCAVTVTIVDARRETSLGGGVADTSSCSVQAIMESLREIADRL